jgi:hypothetical protein
MRLIGQRRRFPGGARHHRPLNLSLMAAAVKSPRVSARPRRNSRQRRQRISENGFLARPWLLCIWPSKFPKMIVHHVPIAAGRNRIDTAIKTRCLNPTAAHRIAFRCGARSRGGVASRAPAYYGVALSSLSRTTRSWGSLALFTRYSNSPLRSGSRLVMTHAPPGTAIDRSRKTVSPVWNLCMRHATHGTIP